MGGTRIGLFSPLVSSQVSCSPLLLKAQTIQYYSGSFYNINLITLTQKSCSTDTKVKNDSSLASVLILHSEQPWNGVKSKLKPMKNHF